MTVTVLQADLDELHGELDAHRNGLGRLAEDPMHSGQPVHAEIRTPTTNRSSGHRSPTTGCRCGPDDLGPVLYPNPAGCRSWATVYDGRYDGACLIAGSDGCDCPDI